MKEPAGVDIDAPRRHGLIGLGRGGCVIRFSGPYHDLDVEIETHIDGPWNGWVRLKYEMTDYWTGEPLAIDDKIFLATSRPPFGGVRWWCVWPPLNRRVRNLYCRSAAVTFGRGARMSLPTPPNERLSMTEPSGALASCA